MSNKARNTSGKFAAKSETPRKIRSVNLTDDAWQWLAEVAAQAGMSRNDYLEAMAEGNIPLMETVKPQASPLIETVESDDTEIAQQPDAEVFPLMETVQTELGSQLETAQENSDFDFAGKAVEVKVWLGTILGKTMPKQLTVKNIRKILEAR